MTPKPGHIVDQALRCGGDKNDALIGLYRRAQPANTVTMTTETFRVALIGLGHRLAHVALHLQRAAPAMRFVAYADPAPTGLARLERAGLEPEAYEDPEAMLHAVKPDAVMIGSPNHLHLEHIRLALATTDARLFCEKPLVRTEEESFALAGLLAQQPPQRLIVGLVLRALPVVKEALGLIRAGALGTITSLEAHEHLHPEHGGFLRRDWRRFQRYAGSYLLDKCCHDLDLLNAVAGARPRRIASFAATRIFTAEHAALDDGLRYRQWRTGWQPGEHVFDGDGDTADLQTLMIEYESGVLGTFHTNSHLNPPRRGWLVAGTEAALEVDLRAARLALHPAREGANGETRGFDGGSMRDHYGADPAMARDLAAAWLEGQPFPVSAKEALTAGLTVMAADRAAARGTVVDLEETWTRLDALWR